MMRELTLGVKFVLLNLIRI